MKWKLHFAIHQGKFDVVRDIVERCPDKKDLLVTSFGAPIHVAAVNGDLEILEYLLQKGFDVNSTNPLGKTPLHRICLNPIPNQTEVVKLLLKYGANVTIGDMNRDTVLHYASANGNLELAGLVINENIIDARNSVGLTPMHLACHYNWLDIVDLLISSGANVNLPDKNAMTPFDWTSVRGVIQPALFLLYHGLEIDGTLRSDITIRNIKKVGYFDRLCKFRDKISMSKDFFSKDLTLSQVHPIYDFKHFNMYLIQGHNMGFADNKKFEIEQALKLMVIYRMGNWGTQKEVLKPAYAKSSAGKLVKDDKVKVHSDTLGSQDATLDPIWTILPVELVFQIITHLSLADIKWSPPSLVDYIKNIDDSVQISPEIDTNPYTRDEAIIPVTGEASQNDIEKSSCCVLF